MSRLPGLDLLRALAIVWVMFFHSFVVGGLGPGWGWLSRYGWMGVELFFVLSGFLIGTQVLESISFGSPLSFRNFYLRRALRILPAYWTVLLLYLLWPGFREAPGMEPWWKFVFFTLNVSIDYPNNSAFSHAWSLCVEEHFYLLFPLLVGCLMRWPAAWKCVALSIGLLVAGIGLRSMVWLHDFHVDPGLHRNWFIEDIYFPTWCQLDGLIAGVALATFKVLRPQAWMRARRYADVSLLAGAILTMLSFWLFRDRIGLVANSAGWPVLSIGFGLLVFAGAGRDSLIGRWNVPGVAWMAAVSYSLYLVHKATYHLVQMHWGAQLTGKGLLAFCAYGISALAAGAVLHYTVERPFLHLRERLAFGHRHDAVFASA